MNIKKLLPAIIVAGAALLAVIIALILPGASATQTAGGVEVSAKASLIGLMFGSTKITSTAMGITMEMTYGGGMSIFGLISFLALIAGIGLIVASIFVADKNLDFIFGIDIFECKIAKRAIFSDGIINKLYMAAAESFHIVCGRKTKNS